MYTNCFSNYFFSLFSIYKTYTSNFIKYTFFSIISFSNYYSTTENNNMNNMSNSNVVEMIPLSCQAETNSVSQIISGISGWIGTVVGVGAASQQSTSSNYKKSVLSNIQRSNTFDASSSSSSSSANSVTPYQLWKDTKALRPDVNHLCGTLMETGLGKVAVVVLSGHQFNGTDSNDSSSSTGITKYGGIEIWNEMYNDQGKDKKDQKRLQENFTHCICFFCFNNKTNQIIFYFYFSSFFF